MKEFNLFFQPPCKKVAVDDIILAKSSGINASLVTPRRRISSWIGTPQDRQSSTSNSSGIMVDILENKFNKQQKRKASSTSVLSASSSSQMSEDGKETNKSKLDRKCRK